MNDDLNLRALHSEVPLQDADYAAIRARVRAEIARREERRFFPLFLRLSFVASVLIVLVIVLNRPAPAPIVVVHTPAPAPPPAIKTAYAPAPLPPSPAARVARRKQRKQESRPRLQLATAEPMRIELQTADPDIRIIWIVQPEPPKENS